MSARMDTSMIGLAFGAAGCAVVGLVFYVVALLREYGPTIREFLLWAIGPQFALGMLFTVVLGALFALALCWKAPHA